MSWLLPIYATQLDLRVCDGKMPSQKCRYLGTDDNNLPCCFKLDNDYKEKIDAEVSLFIKANNKRIKLGAHIDENMPLGDNCPGVRMELPQDG